MKDFSLHSIRKLFVFFLILICIYLRAYPFSTSLFSAGARGQDADIKAFALAESYREMQDYASAMHWYHMRLKNDPYDDFECWFAKWMLGRCAENLSDYPTAIYWYLEAFNEKIERPEPLWDVARLYRIQGKNALGYFFASSGKQLDLDADLSRFYEGFSPYHFDMELSITAYYTKYRAEGFDALERLLLTRDVPARCKEGMQNNLLFYASSIKKISDQAISIEMPFVSPLSSETYHPLNPSILPKDTGYYMILRAVNYTQKNAKDFFTKDLHQVFRTKNFLLDLDQNFSVLNAQEILQHTDTIRSHPYQYPVEGLEDCRLFFYNEALWFSCTSRTTRASTIPQIAVASLDLPNVRVETLVPLNASTEERCEKNWLPFVVNDETVLIYSFDPFLIVKPDLTTGKCSIYHKSIPAYDLRLQRGSAPPIPFADGYLAMSHEVIFQKDHGRSYLHRFIYFTKDFVIQKVSKPFFFLHRGVEFCCSMAWNMDQKELIIPYGYEDREARICRVSADHIYHMLDMQKK